MIGIIDAGNTRIKAAVFQDLEMAKHAVFQNFDHQLAEFFLSNSVNTVFIGSVIHLPPNFAKEFNLTIKSLHSGSHLPIKNAYKTPESLGNDRLANAVGAFTANQNSGPVLSIDMGTCIKYDFVNQAGEYLGGAISPGLQMRFKSLHHFTQKLPLVDYSSLSPFIGQTSVESIQSGVIHGIAAEMDGFIDRYKAEFPQLKVFLTGGDAQYFNQSLKNIIFADPFLTLKGLNRIAQANGI